MYCNIDIWIRKSTKTLFNGHSDLQTSTCVCSLCVFTVCVRLCTLFSVNKAADCIPILLTAAYRNTSKGKHLRHFQRFVFERWNMKFLMLSRSKALMLWWFYIKKKKKFFRNVLSVHERQLRTSASKWIICKIKDASFSKAVSWTIMLLCIWVVGKDA